MFILGSSVLRDRISEKNDLSEADKDIVKALLLEIKPDQMFVAGDLADPHGTHKVCLDAVLALSTR